MKAHATSEGRGREGEAIRRRLTVLMAARLGVSVVAFGLALALLGAGREGAEMAERGLYGTLGLAFLATACFGVALRWVRNLLRFAALQLWTDIAIVTSLVLFSGGVDSIFSFLYLPIVVYGAILFHRRGAFGAAALASASYGGALLAAGPLGLAEALRPPTAFGVTLAAWSVHSGALGLVAVLASALTRELRMAGERLDARTSDLARLRLLHLRTVDSLTSGLLTLDRENRVTSFNPEAERITGCSAEEVEGRALEEILPGAAELLREGAELGARARRRVTFTNPAGELRHLGVSSSILRDGDGSASGRVMIFQDVTEVVAMERDLRRSERLAGVGQLAADIAHEIRNPLAAISGSVEMLRAGLGASEREAERRRLMDIVLREIDRLNGLITDFLQYARPAPPKPEPVCLAEVVRDMLDVSRAGLGDQIQVEVAIPSELWILVDPTQLRQALWNLLANALQAIAGSGRIRVTGREVAGEPQADPDESRNEAGEGCAAVEISVSDTGTGIAPGDLERIFDPFFTTKVGGTGLGLATVHRIVEGNGGSLQVASQLGVGTEVRLRFPRAEGER